MSDRASRELVLAARYPVLGVAEERLDAFEVSMQGLLTVETEFAVAVRERAVERVVAGFSPGGAVPYSLDERDPRVELVSYPVARVLVSELVREVGEESPVGWFALGEAERLASQLTWAREPGASGAGGRLAAERFAERLWEPGVVERVSPRPARKRPFVYRVRVRRAVRSGVEVTRFPVSAGWVFLTESGFREVVESEVRGRVESGLPMRVSPRVSEASSALVDRLSGVLRVGSSDAVRLPVDGGFESVEDVPLPGCIESRFRSLRAGEDGGGVELLDAPDRFAVIVFFAALGFGRGEIASALRVEEIEDARVRSYLRSQIASVVDDGVLAGFAPVVECDAVSCACEGSPVEFAVSQG